MCDLYHSGTVSAIQRIFKGPAKEWISEVVRWVGVLLYYGNTLCLVYYEADMT